MVGANTGNSSSPSRLDLDGFGAWGTCRGVGVDEEAEVAFGQLFKFIRLSSLEAWWLGRNTEEGIENNIIMGFDWLD